MRALVIDDSRTMRSVGFEVLEAGDGQQALDVMEQEGGDFPVLATVDWNMPVMDGLTFVQTLRKNPQWREVSLMMVTTEAEQSQIVRALAAGAHEYLIKPFSPEALVEKLELLGVHPERSLT